MNTELAREELKMREQDQTEKIHKNKTKRKKMKLGMILCEMKKL